LLLNDYIGTTKKVLNITIAMLQKTLLLVFFASISMYVCSPEDARFVTYTVNPKIQNISFYYQNEQNENFKSLGNLQLWLAKKHKKLVYATNGGMYKKDHSPQGLFIQNYKHLSPIDTSAGHGNFYLKPNGVFYTTSNKNAHITTTAQFKSGPAIQYATQSGPMLVIAGKIHPAFKKGSSNVNIRNGVGILPNNQVVFVMSTKEINFYDFAEYFKNLGCTNALYLDGFVSRTYCPGKNWTQMDGDFGVIIGVID
jgi:uncharacterized protein YigE (DUF2233 family)